MLERIKAKRESGEGGFTLIELLLVIVILGILAAVVVFSVKGITDRGTSATCKSTRSAMQTAAEAVYAQTGLYPTSVNPGMASFINTDTVWAPAGNAISDRQTTPNWTLTYAAVAALPGPPIVPASFTVTAAPAAACV
jgi:prepilin-type N-terminal cleavage/methylation domain-containing protein